MRFGRSPRGRHGLSIRLFTIAAFATAIAAAASSAAVGRTATPSVSIVPLSATAIGRAVRVRVAIRGWRTGLRWRIFVDRRYNNDSGDPRNGLAVGVAPGRHVITLDVAAGSSRVARATKQLRITVAGGTDPVIAAAGDIACDPADPAFAGGRGTGTQCREAATANVIGLTRPSAVLPLGDAQYECGAPEAFAHSYGPTWGRFIGITHPVAGNHDYAEDITPNINAVCPPGVGRDQ